MVLDDHELRDDFGDRLEDSDPASMEYYIGTIGLQAYHEYQTAVSGSFTLYWVLTWGGLYQRIRG
jgi:hypothetical protein